MRKFRAAILMLAALMVLMAALVPAYGVRCCKSDATPTLHAQMPCCVPSMAQRDAQTELSTAAQIKLPLQKQIAVTVDTNLEPPAQNVAHARTFADATPPPPTSPLFLLNEQFLI